MKPWIIDGVLKINNSYLPLLNKTEADKRIMLNENSEELSLLGGVYLV